jgi:hypothetical protein
MLVFPSVIVQFWGWVKYFAHIFWDVDSLVTRVIIRNYTKRIWVRNGGVMRFVMIVRHAQGLCLGGARTCPKPTLISAM